ncbi:MAG: peptidase dimerization domain-containing protein [Geminicoccaceae bacterium]
MPGLIEDLLAELPPPFACLVGEPTLMRPTATRARPAYRYTVQGREARSAYPALGANAVVAAARIIAEIAAMGGSPRRGPVHDGLRAEAHHTAGVGRIEGGGQLNIIPRDCRFEFEFRTLPSEDPLRLVRSVERFAQGWILPTLRAHAPGPRSPLEVLAYPGLAPGGDELQLARRCSPSPRPIRVAFGTEAGCFAARGVAALVCGPGDIAVAHKPDEWIALDQLDRCDTFLRRLVRSLNG